MPLDSTYKVPEKPKFDALPDGIYQVIIRDVEPKIEDVYGNPEQKEEKLNFKFEVLESDYIGRFVWKSVRPVMSSGSAKGSASWLYELFKAANKTDPTPEQLIGLTVDEINGLIGKQIVLSVKKAISKVGNNYNKVDGVNVARKDMPVTEVKTTNAGEEVDYDEKKPVDPANIPF